MWSVKTRGRPSLRDYKKTDGCTYKSTFTDEFHFVPFGILQLQSTEEEREEVRGLLGKDWQWVERCRLKGGRGGVGLAVRVSVGTATVLEDMSSEGMLWARVDLKL